MNKHILLSKSKLSHSEYELEGKQLKTTTNCTMWLLLTKDNFINTAFSLLPIHLWILELQKYGAISSISYFYVSVSGDHLSGQ